MVAQVQPVFLDDFRRLPVRSLSASRHPERWREPHYLAFDRLRRRSSAVYSVCILPLIHPGRISAPWLPTTYKPGSHCESPGSLAFQRPKSLPGESVSPHGSWARMSHSVRF